MVFRALLWAVRTVRGEQMAELFVSVLSHHLLKTSFVPVQITLLLVKKLL